MYVRGLAGVLLACACEAAPVHQRRPEPVEAAPDPWLVTQEPAISPRLRITEGPWLELPERVGGVTKEWLDPVVVVTREGIGIAGEQVLALEDGRIPAGELKGPVVPRLVEAMTPILPYPSTMLLVADRRLRFEDLLHVIHSAVRVESRWWAIAVRRPEDPIGTVTGTIDGVVGSPFGRVQAAPTREELLLDDRSFVLAMMIGAETLELAEIRHSGEFLRLASFPREQGFEPVRVFARGLARRLEPTDHQPVVVFGAHPDVPLERVVAALASVGGTTTCDRRLLFDKDRDACWFPQRILVSGATTLSQLDRLRPGSLVVTTEDLEPRRRRFDPPPVRRWRFQGDSCRVEGGPDHVAARLTGRLTPSEARLIQHADGRQRVTLRVLGEDIEVPDLAACAKFVAPIERHEAVEREGVYLTGTLDIKCDLGDVLLRKHPFHVTVQGRVNLAACR